MDLSKPSKVDSATLDRIVIGGGADALVLFYGDWCQDCLAFRPTWNRWVKGRKATIYELEVGKGSPEWHEWDLREIPTVTLFLDGAEEARVDGDITVEQLDGLWKLLLEQR
jgi:thiol-disulfide isomerase/thioredoxin